MKCPVCQFANPENMKFCGQCGIKLEKTCPACGFSNPPGFKFCGECGHQLIGPKREETSAQEVEGERKQVTVLFSDLSGYTAMTERLDPEEVKKITIRIFGDIAKIIDRYEGVIEKYAGDAVMALFGVPTAHEDDPLRAIRAAREIHRLVDAVSPELEPAINQTISMHTGINTGVVVTGDVNLEKGIVGMVGDALNVASRISDIAEAGEILVGQEVFRRTFTHFDFEKKAPIRVKGKAEPLLVYKAMFPREESTSIHRFSVLRAQLIGRNLEMAELIEAVDNMKNGKGRIFSIFGDAGTGKSRLVEEFKAGIDSHEIRWFECHAYPYTQNIPYFPLKDLLNRLFRIEEEDGRETVRQKIESGIVSLVGEGDSIIPYVGSLYDMDYPEAVDVSPEFWKAKLQETMKIVLSALALASPTIFLVEDLHWADPSFVELLRNTLLEVREPAIVLCVYRPAFSLFTSHQRKGLGKIYREIQLHALSPSEAQEMLTSLLMTDRIPSDVRQFVQEKAEGNPFYLEEMVNSLIESEILIREGDEWKLTGSIRASIISSTIQGIIAGRLDRLGKESKRVLQEASVIGRSFLYEILQRISKLQQDMDSCLMSLEQMDLIRTKALQPDLEYVFKHGLTQEVAYSSILMSQRKEIHERIGQAMEQLFSDRLPECYEALAYHFSQGVSIPKAVEYLVKSGEKSHKRYALAEAHQYFKEAYELLSGSGDQTEEDRQRLIDIIIKWGYVHNCRADYKGLEELLQANEKLAESSGDREKLGMFYAWLGWALRSREKLREGYAYLTRALHLGEEIGSQRVIGYACTWLSWTCADRGLLEEALSYGKRAEELIDPLRSDGEFVRFTLSGLGMTHYFRGDCAEARRIGEHLLKFGQGRSDLRCMAMGHNCIGFSYYVAGEHSLAIESFQKAIQVSADTLFTSAARLLLGMTYMASDRFSEAEGTFGAIMQESEEYGIEFLGTAAQIFHGAIQISQGSLNRGLGIVEHAAKVLLESDSRYRYATANHTMGKVYSRLALGESDKSLSLIAKNIGFLVKNVPSAGKKAEAYYGKAIEVAKEIGANGTLGQVYLDLGRLNRAKKRKSQAADCFTMAIDAFTKCNAAVYVKQAEECLASLQ
jgi:class 3 adenylate cyclase/tetratricopeptide (TPR) repeat protein